MTINTDWKKQTFLNNTGKQGCKQLNYDKTYPNE